MSDIFSGLPDPILEEMAKQLVPPGSTAWKQLRNDVFPLRLLTPRFNHYLTSALLKRVTLRLHPFELDDAVAFLTFRRQFRKTYPTKYLSVSRHTLPAPRQSRCGCAGDTSCESHQKERSRATDIIKFMGQAITVCRSGLEELSIDIVNPDCSMDAYTRIDGRHTFFPLGSLKTVRFRGDHLKPILQAVCGAASNLAVLQIDLSVGMAASSAEERVRTGMIRPLGLAPAILCTNNIVWLAQEIKWLAQEIKSSESRLQPHRLEVRLDVNGLDTLKDVWNAIVRLGHMAFFDKVIVIAVKSAIGMSRADREDLEIRFRTALKGREVQIDWPLHIMPPLGLSVGKTAGDRWRNAEL